MADSLARALAIAALNGGGGEGGTTNYNDLENKPKINGVTLTGDKSAEDLGITGGANIIRITGTSGTLTEEQYNSIDETTVIFCENARYEYDQHDDVLDRYWFAKNKVDISEDGLRQHSIIIHSDKSWVISNRGLQTQSPYDVSSNKIATMADVPEIYYIDGSNDEYISEEDRIKLDNIIDRYRQGKYSIIAYRWLENYSCYPRINFDIDTDGNGYLKLYTSFRESQHQVVAFPVANWSVTTRYWEIHADFYDFNSNNTKDVPFPPDDSVGKVLTVGEDNYTLEWTPKGTPLYAAFDESTGTLNLSTTPLN